LIKLKNIISFIGSKSNNRILGNYDEELIIEEVLFYKKGMEASPNVLYLTKEINKILLNNKYNILFVVANANLNEALLQIVTEDSVEEIYREIYRFMFSEYRLYEKKCNLYNSLYSSNDINEILNISENYLNNPIFILDTSYRIIGYSNTASTIDIYTQEYNGESYLLTDIINFMKRDKCIDNIYNSNTAFFQFSDKNLIFCGIQINNLTVSYICILEKSRKFIKDDLELTNTLSEILSVQMQKENLFVSSSGLEEEYYLMDLLSNRIDSIDYTKQRLNDIDFKIHKKIILIVIPYNQIYKDYRHNFGLKQLMNTAKNILGNCIVAYYEEKIILMVSADESDVISKSIKEKFIDFLKFNNLQAGISLIFKNIFETKKFYIQDSCSLELSKHLNFKGNMFYVKDYLEYYLFYLCENVNNDVKKVELDMLIHPLVYELIEMDKYNNSELLKTLMVYLESNRNANATSKKLNIHCSTFFYRFHKIEELLNISLSNSELLFKLELSLKILSYKNLL